MSDSGRTSEPYAVGALRPDQVGKAFPLLEALFDDLTLSQWIVYCDDAEGSADRQIVVAEDAAGYVRGIGIARPPPDHSGALQVPVFIAVSASDPQGVELALLDHLQKLARSGGYSALRVRTPRGESWRRFLDAELPPEHDNGLLIRL